MPKSVYHTSYSLSFMPINQFLCFAHKASVWDFLKSNTNWEKLWVARYDNVCLNMRFLEDHLSKQFLLVGNDLFSLFWLYVLCTRILMWVHILSQLLYDLGASCFENSQKVTRLSNLHILLLKNLCSYFTKIQKRSAAVKVLLSCTSLYVQYIVVLTH